MSQCAFSYEWVPLPDNSESRITECPKCKATRDLVKRGPHWVFPGHKESMAGGNRRSRWRLVKMIGRKDQEWRWCGLDGEPS